jgi:hypothetical protein
MSRENHIDLAVAWDWEFDREFLDLLAGLCRSRTLTFRSVGREDASDLAVSVRSGQTHIGAFLDRAAPDEQPFLALAAAVAGSGTRFLNHPHLLHKAIDKATMHLEFLSHGIDVPYTIIISPYEQEREIELSLSTLAHLGRPFIIKPANTTGGGTGVILGAETLRDVIDSRQHHRKDKYLLQEKILPAAMDGRRAWFRVFSVAGTILPCWWDDLTHCYAPVTARDAEEFALGRVREITAEIASLCRLDFFSTEIAVTDGGRFVTIDYVNEICDMRLQSLHPDGVPDEVVRAIAGCLISSLPESRDPPPPLL